MKYNLILIALIVLAIGLYLILSSNVPSWNVVGTLLIIGAAALSLKAHGKI